MLELGSRRRELAELSNHGLLEGLSRLDREDRQILVEILLHLSEVDRRRLHVEEGHSSLFDYCTRRLGWSESAAGRRIAVARAMERFPRIHQLLLAGEVNLSTVAQVARQLTEENHGSLLDRLRGQSCRQVEAILAELRPARRTRDRVRPLGRRRTTRASSSVSGEKSSREERPEQGAGKAPSSETLQPPEAERSEPRAESTPAGGSDAGSPLPLEDARYEMRFSVGEGFVEDFEKVRQLLSGKYPQGASYEELFATVLADFLKRKDPALREQRREARRARTRGAPCEEAHRRTATSGPSSPGSQRALQDREEVPPVSGPTETGGTGGALRTKSKPATQEKRSRRIPQELRDAVYVRDGGRCTYVSPDGVRCLSRWDLELDHIEPFCRGGSHTPDNLQLRCRAHNLHEARQALGPEFMATRTRARAPG